MLYSLGERWATMLGCTIVFTTPLKQGLEHLCMYVLVSITKGHEIGLCWYADWREYVNVIDDGEAITLTFCQSAYSWLKGDLENTIAYNSVMIACLLMYVKILPLSLHLSRILYLKVSKL